MELPDKRFESQLVSHRVLSHPDELDPLLNDRWRAGWVLDQAIPASRDYTTFIWVRSDAWATKNIMIEELRSDLGRMR